MFKFVLPGRIVQSVGHLTHKSEVLGSISGLISYFYFPSAGSRRAVVSYRQKYVHKALVNSLGVLSLLRKSVVRLTDCPDMTLNVYRGCKTTTITLSSFLFNRNLNQSANFSYMFIIECHGTGQFVLSNRVK